MKKITYEEIFNDNQSFARNIFFLIFGLFVLCASSMVYSHFYEKVDSLGLLKYVKEIEIMFFSVLGVFIGGCIIISRFNLNNRFIQYSLLFIMGALAYAILREKPVRIAFIILLVSFFVFIVGLIFRKTFCTVITFSISWCFVIIYLILLSFFIPKMQLTTGLYSSVTIMLLLYNIFGVKINRLCLKFVFGNSNESVGQFDYIELKNQINLLYLVIFVYLNLFCIFSNQENVSQLSNAINNALITGVGITNVNWKSLVWKDKI